VSLVYNSNLSIISFTDLLSSSLFLNSYEIPILSRNFCYLLGLTLSLSLLTGLLSRQFSFLYMILSHLFILYIFSKHNISSHIIFNKGLEFVSNFFCFSDIALDIQLYFTLNYHPEETNILNVQTRYSSYIYCNYQHDNQSKLLLLVNFSYNNDPSATTSISLFFTDRYYLNISVYSKCNITSS